MTIDEIDDATAAAAFRRLVAHMQYRTDAQNVDLMGLAGFCRNCLGDWLAEASGGAFDKDAGRQAVYGMSYAQWKATHQLPASPDQIAKMAESVARNHREDALDEALDESFPASDPPSMTAPSHDT
ncbi:DUF1244 domain-containing protein [Sphingobium boeckii]|uniref:SMc04008-like domain-containing protein n=1 Tax=Sphingobium boeckii TaxID=1082345 RepID=A0A7W9AKY8_9SPHN|nr:DUF1244 domain-containing protein [Sphingobium boeckii]MBB5687595.1 hypothetical protein [Sphingobium boeckii]